MKIIPMVAVALLASTAAPLFAQDTPDQPDSAGSAVPAAEPDDGGDQLRIGVGGAVLPSYEGSNNYVLIPGGAVQGRVSGHSFSTSGTQFSIDAIPSRDSNQLHFEAGPVVGVRLNRSGRVADDQVRALGKVKAALEVGGFVGITKTGVITSDYDTASARLTVVTDVSGIHESTIISPSISYGTPLSTKAYVGIDASVDFVEDGYARTYFSVDAPGAVRSGLPTFAAKGGLKSYTLGTTAAYALSDDLRKGWSLFATGAYTRLLNDFSASPVTRVAGSPNQFFGGLGIGYTF